VLILGALKAPFSAQPFLESYFIKIYVSVYRLPDKIGIQDLPDRWEAGFR